MPFIDDLIRDALHRRYGSRTPPRLAAAVDHAVFPGGMRVRPRLTLAVAEACGGASPEAAGAAAVAVELLHCASLVHDDLPCFDDADTRRGRPSVVAAFGQPLAVLAGDGLIVAAFEVLAEGCRGAPELLPPLLRTISTGVGIARGIVAGQAWESEASVDVRTYHRQKTGALFEAAVAAGAIAGGDDPTRWAAFSRALGDAYQLADDIADRHGSAVTLGKPTGQDIAHGRPNAAGTLGRGRAVEALANRLATLPGRIPPCPGRAAMIGFVERLVVELTDRFAPRSTEFLRPGSPRRELGALKAVG